MINIPTLLPEQALPLIFVPENEIRDLAYLLWEREGREESDGTDYWLEAERRLRQLKAVKRFVPSPTVVAKAVMNVIRSEPEPPMTVMGGPCNFDLKGGGTVVLPGHQPLGAPSEQEDFDVFTDRSFLSGAQVKSIKEAVKLASAIALTRIEETVEA